MIARLSGKLAETSADTAIIDVGGVGYLVHASSRTLDAIGPVGGEVLILTELQVREDAWTLFGFGSAVERDSFRALTSVQGVGGRLALAILSVLSPDELARAVSQGDKAMIGRANGVGPEAGRPHRQRASGQAWGGCSGRLSRRASRRRRGRMRCPRSATWASSRPKRALPSTPRRTNLDRTPVSTRWSGWRCGRPGNRFLTPRCHQSAGEQAA